MVYLGNLNLLAACKQKSMIVHNANPNEIIKIFQTVIDGFDPDKFRKVNKDSKKNNNYDSGIHVERQFNSSASSTGSSSRGATEIPSMQMPGVPSYDNSERQLLASLEQELGVLWTKQINLPIKITNTYLQQRAEMKQNMSY